MTAALAGIKNLKKAQFSSWEVFWLTVLIMFLTLILSAWSQIVVGDTRLYHQYALDIYNGLLPYRNFHIEYPPGVLPFIFMAGPIGYLIKSYSYGFMVLCSVPVFLVLRNINQRWGAKEALVISGILIVLGQATFFQLDIFAAATLYGCIVALKDGRVSLSATYFAAAVLIKAFPLVCLPAILLYLSRKKIWQFIKVFLIAFSVCLIPFIALSPSGFWAAITYHTGRPLQIESGPAALGFLLRFFGQPVKAVLSHDSVALSFSLDRFINPLSSVVLAICLALSTALLFLKRQVLGNKLAANVALILFIFILCFKVGSPQYLLLPLLLIFFIADEINDGNFIPLAARFFVIGVVVHITQSINYGWTDVPQWRGGILVLLRTILEIELLVWLARRLIWQVRTTK